MDLVILALRILSASSNQKQEAVEAFLQCFIYKYAQLLQACVERKFTAIKATTQSQQQLNRGNQHSRPNRNSKHNQMETKIHVVTIYIRADAPVIYILYIYESNMWPHLTIGQRPKKDNTTKNGF